MTSTEIEQDTAEAEDAYKVSDLIFPPASFLYESDLVSFSVNNKLLRGDDLIDLCCMCWY
jgi:hypothetical protein